MQHKRMRPALAVAATMAMTAGLAGLTGAAHADTAPVIQGVVKDAAGHLVNGWVEVEDVDTTANTVGQNYNSEFSIQDGQYAFAVGTGQGQVPAGNYVMDVFDSSGASVSQWYNDGGTTYPIDANDNASVLPLGTSSETLSPVTLALYPTVTGLVTSPGGNAVQGSVQAIPVVSGTPDDADAQTSQFDSAQNNTLFTNLADGTYIFEFSPTDNHFNGGYYQTGVSGNVGTTEADATQVVVTKGAAHLANVEVTAAPSISGMIGLGPNGSWMYTPTVHWFSDATGTWTEVGSTAMNNGNWFTGGAVGTFDAVVPAGTYKFEVTTGACFPDWCEGAPTTSSGTTAEPTPASTSLTPPPSP